MHSLVSSSVIVFCLTPPSGTDASEVDRLVRILREGDVLAQLRAHEKLIEMGPRAAKAVPVLIEVFKSNDQEQRVIAGQCLHGIGKPAISPLETVIADRSLSASTRSEAAGLLGSLGPKKLDVLLDALRDKRAEVRAGAVGGLGATGREDAIVALAAASDDPSANVRVRVAFALERVEVRVDVAVETLRRLLLDSDQYVREAAIRAMCSHPSHINSVVPDLVRIARGTSLCARIEAIRALATVAEENQAAKRAIIDRLKDPRWEVRAEAAMVVAKMGPAWVEAVPELSAIVTADTPSVLDRLAAIAALKGMGRSAWAARSALREAAFENKSTEVRREATTALWAIVR